LKSSIGFVIWVILSLIIASTARKRGRSYLVFLLLSIFLSPVVGFILLQLKGRNRSGTTIYINTGSRGRNERRYEPYRNTDKNYRNRDDEGAYDDFYADKGENLSESRKLPSDYVVIDIETTGLYPRKNKIIELSALKVRNDAIVDQFTTLCHPGTKISPSVTNLTSITNDMVKDAPKINEVLESYVSFIGDDIVIGHNANFDINFIYANCIKLLEKPFSNNFIDTLKLSREACTDLRHHRLSDMVKHYNITTERLHRSLNDCHATHQVYLKLKEARR
jgi:DNA polymerase III epsilon subunit family exonuclease